MTGDCVVIDLRSRGCETVKLSQVDATTDYEAVNRILHKLAVILEQDLPTVSAESHDRRDLEEMLASCRRRSPRAHGDSTA